MNESNYSTN
jgi:hypothetical protein